jgi:hypothetical protein
VIRGIEKQKDDLKMADLKMLKYLMSLGLGLKWGKAELKIPWELVS